MLKPRVLISTDIGGMDNDDAQSLIHALFYANDLRYVGIVNTRTDDGGQKGGLQRDGMPMIAEIIDAYERDLPNLQAVDLDYPAADDLRSIVRMGSIDGDFPGQLSAGADLIVSEARNAAPDDPLYILTWGPVHDAVAALLSAPDIVPNVRLISIAAFSQDKRNPTALNELERAVAENEAYADLWWINSASAHKGFYLQSAGHSYGINQTLPWAIENATDSGSLADLLYTKYTYDVQTWQDPEQSPDGMKMGDSSSLLYLIDQASDDDPAAESWGGTFVRSELGSQTWVDNPSPEFQISDVVGAGSVARFRDAFLADYAERLSWAKGDSLPIPAGMTVEQRSPDEDGLIRFGGGMMQEPTYSVVDSVAFAEGDEIVFVAYDPGTFRGVNGGNPLNVSELGRFVEVNSIADIEELVSSGSGVSVAVDWWRDVLILEIDKSTGAHMVALNGYGREYAETYDIQLF